jgi:transcriptional regulator with XRE-family HTH domain
VESHRTLTGRTLDLRELPAKERDALSELHRLYDTRPGWADFARRWPQLLRERVWGRKKVPVGAPLYRVAQDLELRLGVAEGRIAPPDYRDHLADLIEEKFKTRAAFCQATGIDPGNLSHVLAGRKDFSLEVLKKVVEVLDVQLDLVPRAEAFRKALGADDDAERLRQLAYRIATLENLKAKAEALPAKRRSEVLPDEAGLFPDDLEGLRTRLRNGAVFDDAIAEELTAAFEEQARVARQIARTADSRRREHTRVG